MSSPDLVLLTMLFVISTAILIQNSILLTMLYIILYYTYIFSHVLHWMYHWHLRILHQQQFCYKKVMYCWQCYILFQQQYLYKKPVTIREVVSMTPPNSGRKMRFLLLKSKSFYRWVLNHIQIVVRRGHGNLYAAAEANDVIITSPLASSQPDDVMITSFSACAAAWGLM